MKEQGCRTFSDKIIEDVFFQKDGVHVLVGEKELVLDSSSYTDLFLYPGKEISEKEYRRLLSLSGKKKAIGYVSRLLSQRRYTYSQVRTKLVGKFALSEKEADEILKGYVESGILDDSSYARDFIRDGLDSGYWFPYLRIRLKEKGILSDVIDAIPETDFDADEKTLIDRLLVSLDRKRKTSPIQKRRQDILSELLRRGFGVDSSRERIDSFYLSMDEEEKEKDARNEELLLKKKAKECYNSLKNGKLTKKQLREKMVSRLVRKGFPYPKVIEEMDKEGF